MTPVVHGAALVSDLAAVLGVAAVAGLLFLRLKQPTVLGYLAAGLVVGPYLPVPVFADPERVSALAELGVVLVMFAIGLEFRIKKLVEVVPVAGLTALVQVGTMLWLGFTLGWALGWDTVGSVFLGACVAISSTMVVTKVFEQRAVEADVRSLTLGVLVIQDVVAIVLIAAMTGVAAGEGLSAREIGITVAGLAAALLALLAGGMLLVPALVRGVVRQGSVEILVVVATGICFVLALVAEHLGYSVALGAFLAGILVAESGEGGRVEHAMQPLRDVFAAIFFVSIGMAVDPRLALESFDIASMVFGVVVLGQLLSVSVAGVLSGNGLRRSVTAGLALGQIGEFAFILAAIGIEADAVPASLQPVLVTVAVLTAFTTPLLFGAADRLVRRLDRAMPARLSGVLSLYESWVARMRGRTERPSAQRRRVRALVADAVGIVVVLVGAAIWRQALSDRAAELLGLDPPEGRIVVALGVAAVVGPLCVALLRNAAGLAASLGDELFPDGAGPVTAIARRTLEAFVLSGAVLVVGVLCAALARPFVPLPLLAPALGLVMLGALAYLWRAAGRMQDEVVRSGAEKLVAALARRAGPEPQRVSAPDVSLPGIDDVLGVELAEGSSMVGRTLAEIDLRAKTGATVLAIRRDEGSVAVPTGSERLRAGDVLALTGASDAVERARALLTG